MILQRGKTPLCKNTIQKQSNKLCFFMLRLDNLYRYTYNGLIKPKGVFMTKKSMVLFSLLTCGTLLAACGTKTAEPQTEKKSSNTVKVEKSSSSEGKEKSKKANSSMSLFEELAASSVSTDEVYVTGDIVVGEDSEVKPGIYDLEVTGGDGHVSIANEGDYYFYASFGLSAPGTEYSSYPSTVRVVLLEGSVVEFSNISKVKFTAVDKKITPSNELGIGSFVVGRDIEPGTYKLSSNVSFEGSYSPEWDIHIVNMETKRSKDQNFDRENSDVAVKLEEGELISIGFFNISDSSISSDQARLVFTELN